MGRLFYAGSSVVMSSTDRILAHLQLVVAVKLARNSAFMLTWRDGVMSGDGTSCMWISRGIPLYFQYASSKQIVINADWVRQLILSADSAGGLHLTQEPGSLDDLRPETNVRIHPVH